VSVTAVNDPPVAENLSVTTAEDTAKDVTLAATDVEGGPLSFSIVAPPTHGTLTGTGANRTYTPDTNYSGPDSFTYKANDGSADSSVATVSVSVTAVNDAPACPDRSLTIAEDGEGNVTPVCSDPEGDAAGLEIVGQGLKGSATVVGSSLRYVGNANANGVDSFRYRATDGSMAGAPATVSVTINPANDAPVCAPVTLATSEDTLGERDPSCSDIDGDGLTYAIVAPAANGTASVVAGKLRYAPNANFNGADSFTYQASDGPLSSGPATASVTITAVNDAPTCSDTSLAATEDTPAERDPVCADIDSGTLSYSIVASGTKGTATVVAGKLRYVPNTNATGSDSFTYRANDGSANSNTATVTVTINAVNDPPVARDVSVTTSEDVPTIVALDGSDVDGDSLGYTIVSEPGHGVLVGIGAARTYTPNLNYSGPDSFTYRVNDGSVDSNVATVSITVTPINDAPVAQDLTSSTPEDTPKVLTLSASDVDGGVPSYTIVAPPAHGTLTGTGATRTYTPDTNYNGPDSFTYKAGDGLVDSNVATVTLSVTAVNDAPSCPARSLTLSEDTEATVTPICSDPEGEAISLEIAGAALKGTASVVGSSLRYVANPNATGADSFTYRATDGALPGAPATVSVTINAVNDAPVCAPITLSTSEETSVERDPSCTDVDGDALTYSIVANGSQGTASVTAGQRLRYVPNLNANGSDSFTYRASDGGGLSSAPATASVTVAAVNDAPACPAQSLTTNEDTEATITPTCTDAEGDPITLEIVTQPTDGTASIVGNSIRFIPNVDANGPDSFTYRGRDVAPGAPATVSVTVNPVNDAPGAVSVDVETDKGVAKVITLTGFDFDNDPLTFRIASLPANGNLRAGPNATDPVITTAQLPYTLVGSQVRYEPNAGFTGTNSFQFRAHDGTIAGPPADARITVLGTNVAPVCSNRTLTVDEDLTLTDTVCSDADLDTLTFTRTGPTHGQLTLFGDGSFEYVPEQDYNGPDSFTVVARDPSGLTSALATVTVTVAPVNDAPSCNAVALSTPPDTPGATLPDCEDVDGDTLTYEIVTQPLNGTASVNGQQLAYVPALGYTGPDSFSYRAGDGTLFSSPATVSVTVTA
jgi:large repetitive protein